MRIHHIAALWCAVVPAFVGCTSAAEEESVPTPTAVVSTVPATSRAFEDNVLAYGSVELAPSASEALTVQAESQLAALFVATGAPVKKGDPIVRLKASAVTSLEAGKAQRDAAAAQADAERMARLHEDGLATDSELQAARAAADTARELRNSLLARVGNADGLTLRAPRSGVVDGLTAQPGDVLPPGTVLARIADASVWQVRLGVEPADVARVRAGQAVQLLGLTAPLRGVAGSVRYVDQRIDPTSRLASAIVIGKGAITLPPGSGVRAYITVGTHEHGVAVPSAAVLYDDNRPFAFVISQGKAQRRDIEIGLQDEHDIEILKGVRQGEDVVVLGNDELTDGMAVRISTDTQKRAAP